mgnify:CR=1 FL=1
MTSAGEIANFDIKLLFGKGITDTDWQISAFDKVLWGESGAEIEVDVKSKIIGQAIRYEQPTTAGNITGVNARLGFDDNFIDIYSGNQGTDVNLKIETTDGVYSSKFTKYGLHSFYSSNKLLECATRIPLYGTSSDREGYLKVSHYYNGAIASSSWFSAEPPQIKTDGPEIGLSVLDQSIADFKLKLTSVLISGTTDKVMLFDAVKRL